MLTLLSLAIQASTEPVFLMNAGNVWLIFRFSITRDSGAPGTGDSAGRLGVALFPRSTACAAVHDTTQGRH